MLGCDCCCLSSFVYLVGGLTIASKVIPFVLKKITGDKPVEIQEKNFKENVVYLYQFPGTATASSTSPFCIKVEAFCRLHNIKFERRNMTSGRGRNGQLPFIELNGVHHSDSQIILRRITQHFDLKTYPDEQTAAIGHAVDRMLENHFFNQLIFTRETIMGKVVEVIAAANGLPSFLLPIASRLGSHFLAKTTVERAATSVGKFKESEYKELLRNDMIQLQTILGSKKFMLGEEPTQVDCTAIGQFGFAYFAVPSARYYLTELIESPEFAPLLEYLERVKTRIFGSEFHDIK